LLRLCFNFVFQFTCRFASQFNGGEQRADPLDAFLASPKGRHQGVLGSCMVIVGMSYIDKQEELTSMFNIFVYLTILNVFFLFVRVV
jgi:hypothetical protein